jgi:hypothetical protein
MPGALREGDVKFELELERAALKGYDALCQYWETYGLQAFHNFLRLSIFNGE